MKRKRRDKKRGWIRIVEAFVAILLITGVLLFVLQKGYIGRDISDKIYSMQLGVLREIQLDENLRIEILEISSIPIQSNSNDFPINVTDKINEALGEILDCQAKICELDKICVLDEYREEDIYSQSVSITASPFIEEFSPKQLKIFCSLR
jgi:hypothetical protein